MKQIVKYRRKIALLAALALAFAMSFNRYLVFVGINAAINAVAVMGIVIITGYAKQLHLGQAAFVGIGAYTSAILVMKSGFSFWLSIPVAILFSGGFGFILSIPTLKLKGGSYLALVTQTFGEIIYILLLNLKDLTNGPFGITNIKAPTLGPVDFTSLQNYFFLCVFFVIVVYFFLRRIVRSKFGRFFTSIGESEEAAKSLGINTRKYKMIAFVIATSIAGLAGALYGPFIGYLSPEQFRWQPSLILVSMAIVGGLSSLEGGIIGAVLLTFLPELLRSADQLRMILYGVIVILTLGFMPDGIMSIFGKSFSEIKILFSHQWDILIDRSAKSKARNKMKKKAVQDQNSCAAE